MKQLFPLLFFAGALVGCKKSVDPSPAPPGPDPTPATYTVQVDTVGSQRYGTVSPINTSVASGGSVTITISPKQGCRVNLIAINGISAAIANTVVLNNITANMKVKVGITDSLTLHQLDSMKNGVPGTWYYTEIFQGRGDVLLQLLHLQGDTTTDRQWTPMQIATCAKDMRLVFSSEGSAQQYLGAHPCGGEPANFLEGNGTWALSSNGKWFMLVDPQETKTLEVVSISATKIEWIDPAELSGGYIRKYTLEHTSIP